MERSDFNEILEGHAKLSSFSKEEYDELADKYPYATLLQLLNIRRKGETTADKKKLLLYVDNPLHLSVVTSKRFTQNSEDISLQGQLDKNETSQPLSEETVQKEENHPLEKSNSSQEVVEDVSDGAMGTKETLLNELVEDEKDVLELINELPEESPIKRGEAKTGAVEKNEEKSAEDPGDLMVMMSFTDWLNHFKTKSEHEAEEKKGKDAIRSAWQKEKLAEAMDDEEDVVPDKIFEKAMKSVSFGDGLVTEPLAELYVQQGKTEKAIELYKKLSLLNPEKRTYFASRIKDLHLLK